MEGFISSQGQKQNQQTPPRKYSWNGSQKDLWFAVREGSLTDVDSVLALVKKNGGNINTRNMFGLTPLHIATWRNHIPIVKRLLAAGADPDTRDGESGWSSLHRALHFGHLAVASILLQSGASITAEDSKSRTPVDLLSGSVFKFVANEHNSVATELFSWGSGVNYQLGTGNAHIQKLPCKVDSLHGCFVKVVSAAKFHSVAVSARGEVYTWGFGRGGRLGHPEFDIHSGQAAVITPRQVTSGLGSCRVKLIAAAKHHTIIATEGGEVFTWGSNREGQLGYTSVDTQPTPRRVSSLRSKIVAVAAANKHTAVISESGEVFTWGCNKEGQLGYGTSNSASNYTPRVVEYLKGKILRGVAAAKKHTITLGIDGEVFTWGHRLVTPRRVVVARNNKKSGGTLLKFHRMERLHVVAIAAGMVHSMALTDDGTLFCWVSSDPDLRCQQLFSLCGKNMVSISAGKYWTAAVTSTGDVYMWDGKKSKDKPPVPTRLYGIKRATSVAVGETHLLMVGSLYHPVYSLNEAKKPQKPKASVRDDLEDYNEDFVFNEVESNDILSTIQKDDVGNRSVPSLKCLCEKVASEFLVEPRNAIQVLEIADSLGADSLKKYCEEIVICNFDYILTVSSHAVASTSPDILANLDNLLDLRSSEPWSRRRLPTPTSTLPVVITSEEEDSESHFLRIRDNHKKNSILNKGGGDRRLDCFLKSKNDPNEGFCKQVRAIRKKLQQIEMLEAKQFAGHLLDDQQISKLQTKSALECLLAELGVPVEERLANASSSVPPDGKCSKRLDVSGKQKRKSKQKVTQVEAVSGDCGTDVKPEPIKSSLDVEMSQVSKHKEGDTDFGESAASRAIKESSFSVQKKDIPDLPRNRSSLATTSRKKNKKGGLSMFLSGALDDAPKAVVPPPPTPKSEGPAWGGVKVSKGSTSLREILDEQSKRKEIKTPTDKDNMEGLTHKMKKDHVEDHFDDRCSGKIPLSSLFFSNPIPMVSTCTSQVSDGERSTPPWAASSGTPPLLSRPSLRDIQMQQIKPQACLSHSPKTRTAGFIVATGQASPSDSAGSNCWYKPEVDSPSSIRSIQIEERAIKDLKRFYSSVKLVKNQS